MKKKLRDYKNSFYFRILLMVLVGISITAITVSFVVLIMSKSAFNKTYTKSQEKVFDRIENELNDFHESLLEVVNAIDTSWAFRLYLNSNEMDNLQAFQNIHQMEADLEKSKSANMERLNILVLSADRKKHYLSRTETISVSDEEIWESKAVKLAVKEPEVIHYSFSEGAYTMTTKDTDVIIVSKALYYQEREEVYGVVLATLTMEDMKKYYDYFVTEYTEFYLVGDNDRVFCSSDKSSVGNKLPSFSLGHTVMKRDLNYLGCTMYGVIDSQHALGKLYNMSLLIIICVAIGIVMLAVGSIYTRQTIRPLSQLVEKMSTLKEGNFTEYMPLSGTSEVQELASTYNYMLDDIQNYIKELLRIQKEKRKSEIKALQMQINPHYIYNTLASIKWLLYRNDTDTIVKTMDAFISLLRNTISNADEFITVEQEIRNLDDYILINHVRYGEAVKVEYFISNGCKNCLLPKLLIQPFIENAFFHAFPDGKSGTIQIVMQVKDNNLEIKVIDDGVGMTQEQAQKITTGESNKEHFTGIGINNVQDRIKLIYGKEYGLVIDSVDGVGTSVTIKLPAREKENTDEE
ncbi:MAG: sensor histidine kinase [Lachnospiraceae bacterium]|nr:sensor histidine kinase [Lachnospiraceae bacterium]